ncbi:hypothetical protein AO069_27220 [Pseudomonas syringae pv. syringae PD2774]|nr:hypothetical protein AO069_27220 [Pseudomonas syringae pv. syringae PD2774]
MAIEDALVLSLEFTGEGSLQARVERFMARRFERCKFIIEKTLLVGDREMARDQTFGRICLTKQMLKLTAEPI